VQENVPIEMDKPISHSTSMKKTVGSEISPPTVSKELVGESWFNNFTGSITDPEVSIRLQKELEKGQASFYICLSFLQKALLEQRRANKDLSHRLNDDKLFLIALREKIRKCKSKLMEASKIDVSLGENLAHTQVETKDAVRLKEQRKTSPDGKCDLVIVESGDKSISEDQPIPANEQSSPPITVCEDQKGLQEDQHSKISSEEE